MNIFFTSAAHKQRLLTAMQQLGRVHADNKLDQEYLAALYLLTADVATWNKASAYIDDEGIDIELLLAEVDFSGGYSVLIKLAGNLFNGDQHLDPLEFLRLDQDNFQLALDAIKLRRFSLRLADLQ